MGRRRLKTQLIQISWNSCIVPKRYLSWQGQVSRHKYFKFLPSTEERTACQLSANLTVQINNHGCTRCASREQYSLLCLASTMALKLKVSGTPCSARKPVEVMKIYQVETPFNEFPWRGVPLVLRFSRVKYVQTSEFYVIFPATSGNTQEDLLLRPRVGTYRVSCVNCERSGTLIIDHLFPRGAKTRTLHGRAKSFQLSGICHVREEIVSSAPSP